LPGLIKRVNDECRWAGDRGDVADDDIDDCDIARISTLLNDLLTLEAKMQRWLLLWYADASHPIMRTVSTTSFPHFLARHDTLAGTFPRSLAFENLLDALATQTTGCTCCNCEPEYWISAS